MSVARQPGKLVTLRDRDWVVLPSNDDNLLIVKPLGGSDDETTGIYLPLEFPDDEPIDARFALPSHEDLGDISTTRLLYDAARLAFRNGAGPFRCLAKLSFRPRAYQIVPLVMALRQNEIVRLLIADDVGVGKTIEALLVVKEMLERRKIKRFAVVCLPHLCDQWQEEIRSKLGIDAVIIRSNTQARLDRQIQGDRSVYDYYPYQIISIDYIKADTRRDVFVQQCPKLVIVDEAHTCTCPAGASAGQQQRYHLIKKISEKEDQNLVMLTATPHSGKSEEFHSLLGLLKPEFELLDLPTSNQKERKTLAKHFVQRKRADVEKWMDEETPFPKREATELPYDLSNDYGAFFEDIVEFARKLVSTDNSQNKPKQVHYWTALGLLRGVMSSPSAGIKMLETRLEKLALVDSEDSSETTIENPVGDLELGVDTDNTPTQVMQQEDWTEHQKKQLRQFAKRLETLVGFEQDRKLFAASIVIEEWINEGFKPVIFCRYIATANYLGEQLATLLKGKIPKLDLQVITSELPDDLRKQQIDEMEGDNPRVLVATDCLSEGINLQKNFTAVLHYDLPWNPNRIEQREGRVDRYGQNAKLVKACLLYGEDNPIDGIVLDVLLRKVREIKKATGINVPFPEDSQSIIDTITKSLLLSPDRKIQRRRDENQAVLFDYTEFGEIEEAKSKITRKIDEAADREKVSRGIFAQNAIKAEEIEQDLRGVDDAIGDPGAVKGFVIGTLETIFGVQVTEEKSGFGIIKANLPPQITGLLPNGDIAKVSFISPTPEGYTYLGRNHRFVEQLCQIVMSNTMMRHDKRAARASVIRTKQVECKTTLLLFRCRNVIEQSGGKHQIVAEEMLLWGWQGTATTREFIDHEHAIQLLRDARASSNLTNEARGSFLNNELALIGDLETEFESIAEKQSKRLVEAHERFSELVDKKRFQVVYPVLPMDLMGIYVLLPEGGQ
jgi:superfamily II DNA or RNA helicase